MPLQGQVSAPARPVGEAPGERGFVTPQWEEPTEGQGKAKVLYAGAGLGTAPGVEAAGPDDVAWRRLLPCTSREPGAAGTARGLVPTRLCW